jgi:hypothetical protein
VARANVKHAIPWANIFVKETCKHCKASLMKRERKGLFGGVPLRMIGVITLE